MHIKERLLVVLSIGLHFSLINSAKEFCCLKLHKSVRRLKKLEENPSGNWEHPCILAALKRALSFVKKDVLINDK